MSETQIYYVVMLGNEYIHDPGFMSTTKYLYQANIFLNIESASWYVSERFRHGMQTMSIKMIRMTVEDDNGCVRPQEP